MRDIGKNIKMIRQSKEMTHEALAEVLFVTRQTVSNYENGRRDIPSEVWNILADYYGVSVDYLMGRTNIKDPYPKNK